MSHMPASKVPLQLIICEFYGGPQNNGHLIWPLALLSVQPLLYSVQDCLVRSLRLPVARGLRGRRIIVLNPILRTKCLKLVLKLGTIIRYQSIRNGKPGNNVTPNKFSTMGSVIFAKGSASIHFVKYHLCQRAETSCYQMLLALDPRCPIPTGQTAKDSSKALGLPLAFELMGRNSGTSHKASRNHRILTTRIWNISDTKN